MAAHLAGPVRDMPPPAFAAALTAALSAPPATDGAAAAPALAMVELGASGDVRLLPADAAAAYLSPTGRFPAPFYTQNSCIPVDFWLTTAAISCESWQRPEQSPALDGVPCPGDAAGRRRPLDRRAVTSHTASNTPVYLNPN